MAVGDRISTAIQRVLQVCCGGGCIEWLLQIIGSGMLGWKYHSRNMLCQDSFDIFTYKS